MNWWVDVNETTGCWEWAKARDPQGYGRVGILGTSRSMLAHRYLYELLVGPIPDGLTLDHLCRNPCCVRPSHLEPVTARENSSRGMGPTWIARRTGVCSRGHSEWRVRLDRPGQRQCRVCDMERNRARRRVK